MLEILILVWVIDYVSSKLRARVEGGASGDMAQQMLIGQAQLMQDGRRSLT